MALSLLFHSKMFSIQKETPQKLQSYDIVPTCFLLHSIGIVCGDRTSPQLSLQYKAFWYTGSAYTIYFHHNKKYIQMVPFGVLRDNTVSHFLGSYGYKYIKIARRKYLTAWQTPVSVHA